jgi:acyl-CoA synthetase (NDP forming)
VLTCFVGCEGTPDVLRGARSIPSYIYPESAARALGHAAQRAIWLRRPVGQIPAYPECDRSIARSVVEGALRRAAQPWLGHDEIVRLLTVYGLPTPAEVVVHSPEEAADAARRIGNPVALKLISRTIVHKSDVGGVRLNLRAPEAAADAYRAMVEELTSRGLAEQIDGAIVQEMASAGTECLVGVVTDPTFGPLIAFGLGGVAAEVIGDVSFRLHPLTNLDADELIAASRASRLMAGFRGAPPADVPALRDLLLRLSRLVDDLPELAELDFNPVIVREAGHGALVVDARIRLSRPA